MAFAGFSTDTLIGLPPELFSEVLPAISLASELKVTMHIFYRLSRQRGAPRRLSWDELLADKPKETLEGLPSGVNRWFKRTSFKVRETYHDVSEEVKDERAERRARKEAEAAGGEPESEEEAAAIATVVGETTRARTRVSAVA